MDEKTDEMLVIDGVEHSLDFVKSCVRFALKYQYGTVDEILKDRGLLPVDGALLATGNHWEHVGDGWMLFGGHVIATQHLLAGLRVPYTWLHREEDGDSKPRRDAEARAILREKMDQLGDAIWETRGK